MRGTGVPPHEPAATCDACGALGTVGRVFRANNDGVVFDVHRFCFSCWTHESQRLIERWELERAARPCGSNELDGSSGSIQSESATWDNALFLVSGVEAALQNNERIAPEALAQFVRELEARASDMIGPMPEQVAHFIQQHRANAT